jgi:hypothetical protein
VLLAPSPLQRGGISLLAPLRNRNSPPLRAQAARARRPLAADCCLHGRAGAMCRESLAGAARPARGRSICEKRVFRGIRNMPNSQIDAATASYAPPVTVEP